MSLWYGQAVYFILNRNFLKGGSMKGIIVHGGSGKWPLEKWEKAKEGVREAAQTGFEYLRKSGDPVEACVRAVMSLEDNPVFNAGTGAVLTLDGRVEMDASIMKGSTLEAGAVAGVENIKNPILLARKVMEETDHVLLAGEGAMKFARAMGFEYYNPITEERRKKWMELKEKFETGEAELPWHKMQELIKKHPELLGGTVGCVAISEGEIVAGTSTGGVFFKLFGRVGDTPLIGAGTYATSFGGASATGIGEGIIRVVLSKSACDFMRIGVSAPKAAEAVIDIVNSSVKTATGIITIDHMGNIGFAHNTPTMPVAYIKDGEEFVYISPDE